MDMKKDKEKYFLEAKINVVYSHCLFYPGGSGTLPDLQSKVLGMKEMNRYPIFKALF